MEIDPLIQRALGLLVSRRPDSTENLKQLLFNLLGREYVPPSISKTERKFNLQQSHSHDSIETIDDDEANDMGADTDCDTDVGGAKNDDTMDADDFAFDMGISCVICRQFDVSSNNQLLECQDCHSLYHQLCHKPVVGEGQDDWRCYKCTSATKGSPEKVKSSKAEEKVKKESNDSLKKGDKKSEKSSNDSKKGNEASKEKKVKSDRKLKDKIVDKGKETDKEKAKKHKGADKESKGEGSSHIRKEKDKVGTKASESNKSNSGPGSSKATSSSKPKEKGSESRAEKHKQSSSTTSSDLKHKKSDSHDKDKKAKKIKREKAE